MCFSAGASFGAAALLGIAGTIALKKTNHKSELMFAGIPILFAAQQATEGVLWLSLTNSALESWHNPTFYLFLFFAHVLWSSWIPISILILETNKKHKKLLKIIAASGVICSVLLAFRLVEFPASAEILDHHIYYNFQAPQIFVILSTILYSVATILPFFLSEVKHMKILGGLLAVSVVLAKIFYRHYFISVWCFFAAFISIFIIYILHVRIKNKRIES